MSDLSDICKLFIIVDRLNKERYITLNCSVIISIIAGLELSPDAGLFELAGVVVFAKFVLRLAPSETVVPETSQPSIGDGNHQCDCGHEEQVRHAVIHNQTLRELREGA